MDGRKKKFEIQELIKEFSGLARKYRLRIDSKQKGYWSDSLKTEAGVLLVKAFRLGCFKDNKRLSRIIASFHTTIDAHTNYSIIFQTVCEKYLSHRKKEFDFDLKLHQFGVDKAIILAIEWFADYLSNEFEKTVYIEEII